MSWMKRTDWSCRMAMMSPCMRPSIDCGTSLGSPISWGKRHSSGLRVCTRWNPQRCVLRNWPKRPWQENRTDGCSAPVGKRRRLDKYGGVPMANNLSQVFSMAVGKSLGARHVHHQACHFCSIDVHPSRCATLALGKGGDHHTHAG